MKSPKLFWLTLLAATLTIQPAFAIIVGDPPLTVSDGGTLPVDENYNVFGNDGITALGDNNTINISTSGSIASNQDAISSDGEGQTINNAGTISGSTGINFCYDEFFTVGNDTVISSGTITGTDGVAIKLGYGNDTLTLEEGSIVNGDIKMSEGDDVVTNNGTVNGYIYLGPGNDVLTSSGNIHDYIYLGDGDDTFTFNGETLSAYVYGGGGDDTFNLTDTTVENCINTKSGNDTVNIYGNVLLEASFVFKDGDDEVNITEGSTLTLGDDMRLGQGNDTLIIGKDATLKHDLTEEVSMAYGEDNVYIYGTLDGYLGLGPDVDTITLYDGAVVKNGYLCGGYDEGDLVILDGGGVYESYFDGFSELKKTGDGTWELNNEDVGTFDDVTITAGTLAINGGITIGSPSTFIIEEAGTLTGDANIYNGPVHNYGIVAPGSSIGTITVTGDYTQETSGQLVTEIGDGTSDLLDVTGEANISGGLDVQIAGELSDGETHTFLATGSGLYGEFATITGSAFYDFDVIYDDFNASLNVTELTYAEVGLSGDQVALIEALKEQAANGNPDAQEALFAILNLGTTGEATSTMGSLTPEQYASSVDIGMVGYNLYRNTVTGRMGNLHLTRSTHELQYASNTMTANGPAVSRLPAFDRRGEGWNGWVRFLGMTGEQDNDGALQGYDYDTRGFSLGFDNKLNDNLAIGVGVGVSGSEVDFDNAGQETDVDTRHIGLYSTYSTDTFYIDTAVFYADNDYDSTRAIPVAGLTAEGNTDGYEVGLFIGVGYDIVDNETMYFIPTVSLNWAQADIDGFTETGAGGLNLTVNDYDADSLVTSLGFRWGGKMTAGETRFEPELRLAWAHEFGNTDRDVKASFSGTPGTTFTMDGVEPEEDSAMVGLGANFYMTDTFTFYVDYDGEFRSDYEGHALSGGIRYGF